MILPIVYLFSFPSPSIIFHVSSLLQVGSDAGDTAASSSSPPSSTTTTSSSSDGGDDDAYYSMGLYDSDFPAKGVYIRY